MNKQTSSTKKKWFVTGWHHSGTTIVQHSIAEQLGMDISKRLPEKYPNSLDNTCQLYKMPSNSIGFIENLQKIMNNKKIHIIIVVRNANDMLNSLQKRSCSMNLSEEANKYINFLKFLTEVFIKKYDNYTIINLDDFVNDPDKFLKNLGFETIIHNKKLCYKEKRPHDKNHNELREWQIKQEITPDIIQHTNKIYSQSIEIEKYYKILLKEKI